MREKRRVLKFKKFKVANLNSRLLIGGALTDGNCDTSVDDCTRTVPKTHPRNPCVADGTIGCQLQTGAGCP